MNFVRAIAVAVLAISIGVLAGCKRDTAAKPVSLAKFGGKLTLRINAKKGDKFAYDSLTTMASTGGRVDHQLSISDKAEIEVMNRTNKNVTIAVKQVQFDVKGEESAATKKFREKHDLIQGILVSCTFDMLANPQSVKADTNDPKAKKEAEDFYSGGTGLLGAIFPKAPVAIGDQWQTKYDLTKALAALKIKLGAKESSAPVRFTLVGAEEVDGRTVAVIDHVLEFNYTPQAPAVASYSYKASGKMRIDIATGMLVRDTVTTTTEVGINGKTVTVKSEGTSKLVAR